MLGWACTARARDGLPDEDAGHIGQPAAIAAEAAAQRQGRFVVGHHRAGQLRQRDGSSGQLRSIEVGQARRVAREAGGGHRSIDIEGGGGIGPANAYVTVAPMDQKLRARAEKSVVNYETVAGAAHVAAGLWHADVPDPVFRATGRV